TVQYSTSHFLFNATATPQIYTLSLHDALPISNRTAARAKVLADSFDHRIEVLPAEDLTRKGPWDLLVNATPAGTKGVHDDEQVRSEEHTSELQSRFDLVCRLLLEKKKKR